MAEQQRQFDPLDRFSAHVDIVLEQFVITKAEKQREGLSLEPGDLAVQIKLAGRQLLDNAALDLGTNAADGVALTLLQIYESGVYGGGFLSPGMDRLAKILLLHAPKEVTSEQ